LDRKLFPTVIGVGVAGNNSATNTNQTQIETTISDPSSKDSTRTTYVVYIVAPVVCAVFVMSALLTAFVLRRRRRIRHGTMADKHAVIQLAEEEVISESSGGRGRSTEDYAADDEPDEVLVNKLTWTRLHLVQVIGNGAQGCVTLAVHSKTKSRVGTLVALKFFDDPEAARAEMGIHSSLPASSNIVKCFGCNADADGKWYVAMEYCQHGSLWRCMESGAMPRDRRFALRMLCDALTGMAHAHRNMVAHKDVKPENILVRCACSVARQSGMTRCSCLEKGAPGVCAQLSDFGLAKEGSNLNFTSGRKRGTFLYLPPEQLKRKSPQHSIPQDHFRADIFAFGVVSWELLFYVETGKARPLLEVMRSQRERGKGLVDLVDFLDGPQRVFIMKCMAANPEGRFASGSEALSAMHGILNSGSQGSSRSGWMFGSG